MPESSTSPSPISSSVPAKRACDACHRRKIKCIVESSILCKNCAAAGLRCTYNAVPQKKGPKGSRAKVISELRETQQRQPRRDSHGYVGPSSPPPYERTAGLLSLDVVSACVDFFFFHIYPTQPTLHRQRVHEAVLALDQSDEAYCSIGALCAYVLIHSNMPLPGATRRGSGHPHNAVTSLGTEILEEVSRIRKSLNYMETPNLWTVMTSFFLFGCYFSLDQHNMAWFHLREATTLAITMGMDREETYTGGNLRDVTRRRRLFWLLFITERTYALQRHRPVTLHASIQFPTVDEDPQEVVELTGFCHLISLFKPFDHTFISLWNKTPQGCTSTWMAHLQTKLTKALPIYLHSTETQAVHLHTSQQWLRTVVWQLSISQGFLSSTAVENAMSFKYPIEIARDMMAATRQFSQQAMEIHGVDLVEKIFDIACALTDVMAILPMYPEDLELRPREYLSQLVSLLSRLRGGQQRFLPLLLSKINDTIPNLASSINFSISSMSSGTRPDDQHADSRSSSSSHSATSSSFSSPPASTPRAAYSDMAAGTRENSLDAFLPSEVRFGENSTAPAQISKQLFEYDSNNLVFPRPSEFS
ncbi:hypothetical protein EV356DRAFT_326838 [Viridothelium virens]|uniref:Zn(2)-C6 fungal-type domain-containing protein n=1 Tax=Viridothelium virens TaxID=1048519 RepID=A0A6A6GY91_VIRVR|nr:hypothetical protein EV356DRAFT_326838 [Viridothelium virens]